MGSIVQLLVWGEWSHCRIYRQIRYKSKNNLVLACERVHRLGGNRAKEKLVSGANIAWLWGEDGGGGDGLGSPLSTICLAPQFLSEQSVHRLSST